MDGWWFFSSLFFTFFLISRFPLCNTSLGRMEGASMVRIDRKSSIESEPRTLNINQIQCAREAALYVVNTMNMEEAMNIFTKGLKPVVSGIKQNGDTMMMDQNEEYDYSGNQLGGGPRDVVSAPF